MSHKSKPGITELESDLKYSYELTILKISQEVHKIMSAVCAIIPYTVDELTSNFLFEMFLLFISHFP